MDLAQQFGSVKLKKAAGGTHDRSAPIVAGASSPMCNIAIAHDKLTRVVCGRENRVRRGLIGGEVQGRGPRRQHRKLVLSVEGSSFAHQRV